jgi:hypothetical protein
LLQLFLTLKFLDQRWSCPLSAHRRYSLTPATDLGPSVADGEGRGGTTISTVSGRCLAHIVGYPSLSDFPFK